MTKPEPYPSPNQWQCWNAWLNTTRDLFLEPKRDHGGECRPKSSEAYIGRRGDSWDGIRDQLTEKWSWLEMIWTAFSTNTHHSCWVSGLSFHDQQGLVRMRVLLVSCHLISSLSTLLWRLPKRIVSSITTVRFENLTSINHPPFCPSHENHVSLPMIAQHQRSETYNRNNENNPAEHPKLHCSLPDIFSWRSRFDGMQSNIRRCKSSIFLILMGWWMRDGRRICYRASLLTVSQSQRHG